MRQGDEDNVLPQGLEKRDYRGGKNDQVVYILLKYISEDQE